MDLLEVKDRAAWRAWLRKYGRIRQDVWLVYYKKASGKLRIAYGDAVEEAICFGWIDGKVRRLDDNRFAQRFTPRRTGSRWSAINIGRARKMMRDKKMTPLGIAAFHPERKIESHPNKMPAHLQKEFQSYTRAWQNFKSFPPYYQRMTIAWVANPKKEATQKKRLQQLIKSSDANTRIKFM